MKGYAARDTTSKRGARKKKPKKTSHEQRTFWKVVQLSGGMPIETQWEIEKVNGGCPG